MSDVDPDLRERPKCRWSEARQQWETVIRPGVSSEACGHVHGAGVIDTALPWDDDDAEGVAHRIATLVMAGKPIAPVVAAEIAKAEQRGAAKALTDAATAWDEGYQSGLRRDVGRTDWDHRPAVNPYRAALDGVTDE